MFYLTSLFNISKNSPIKTFLFFIVSFTWLVLAANESFFNKKALSLLPIDQNGDHFHALVSSSKNVSWISRKMRALPGVFIVNTLNEKQLEKKVQTILGEVDSSLKLSISDLGYEGLKVIFKEGIAARSQTLIRNYMVKLLGENFVTLGAIVSNRKIMKFEYRAIHFLRLQGHNLVMGVMAILWIIFYFMWREDFQREIYLLERFQRSNHLGFKSYSLVLALVMGACLLLITYFTQNISWWKFVIPTGFMVFSAFFMLRRYRWDS